MSKNNKKTVGEIEIESFELPEPLKEKIKQVFKLNGERSAGRPNLLQMVAKNGHDPYRFVLEIVYRRMVMQESLEAVTEFANRKYKLDTVKTSIFYLFKQLEQSGLLNEIVEASQKVKRKVRLYYEENGEFKSDVDYIAQWIERNKHVKKPHVLRSHLRRLEYIVNALGGKLPHEWTEQDVTFILNNLYEYYKKGIIERAKKNAKGFYAKLSEKELDDRARENVRRYLTTARVFLKWIGRADLAERFPHTEWKREYTLVDYLSVEEFNKVMESPELDDLEKFILKLHVTLGCREGHHGKYGLMGLQWSKVDWNAATIDVYESKTKGGVIWKGCYLNLFFPNFISEMRYWYEHRVKDSDYIIESLTGYSHERAREWLLGISRKVSKIIGRPFRPHFLRKTHAVWLIEADVPLELIAGKPSQAFFGVGWEDVAVLLQHYGAFTRQKIQRELAKVQQVIVPRLRA
jgi:integrase